MCPISPLDDRYKEQLIKIEDIFSEFSLVKNRLRVEIEYLIMLLKYLHFKEIFNDEEKIRGIYDNFGLEDFKRVKVLERMTKHDVKALEYYLREKFKELGLADYIPYIHLGLTSEDVNNIAYSTMLDRASKEYMSLLKKVIYKIIELGRKWKNVVILSRTHGQPAIPTTLGKELMRFAYRLCRIYGELLTFRFPGKINGAVGNYNALVYVFPDIDWISFSKEFVSLFGLEPILISSQRNIHEPISDYLRKIVSINYILLNFVRDIWMYIMLGYFRLSFDKEQVGSSTMPHKVNPIYFENAEGNIIVSNAILERIAGQLQVSRFQRDLSDSTIKRNYGVGIGHSYLALKSILKGLEKLDIDINRIEEDLDTHWEVLSEAVQVFLRVKGYEDAYEKIRILFQGKSMRKREFKDIIKRLEIPDELKIEILELDIHDYIGLSIVLSEKVEKYCLKILS